MNMVIFLNDVTWLSFRLQRIEAGTGHFWPSSSSARLEIRLASPRWFESFRWRVVLSSNATRVLLCPTLHFKRPNKFSIYHVQIPRRPVKHAQLLLMQPCLRNTCNLSFCIILIKNVWASLEKALSWKQQLSLQNLLVPLSIVGAFTQLQVVFAKGNDTSRYHNRYRFDVI